ncbi:SusC/RagA family TonB-linked outer membrane protein [Penaeicola halotolerans]|uniref:SusC/RagA family TonB-linked outer membrane protein n=1 Tax=Penaeicola halotolerans TaxID=2793196 RepID=UPI001CF89FFA|nr:SusC/RagA family TonB-linked outer membrane protein [Penaeicola halotolerans]
MKHIFKMSLVCLLIIGSTGWTFAQYVVTGRVTDAGNSQPLFGVNVGIRGTTLGTITDDDGRFSLEVPNNNNATIVVAFLGYTSQTFQVGPNSNTNLNVALREDITNLEEVVVTGLASSVKRSNLANSVSSVSARELTGTTTIQTTDGALYGKVAGANIRSNGGAPGGGLSIQLRGLSSLQGASQPLIILDGVYINNSFQRTGRASASGAGASNQDDGSNRLADINPADIESIEVLKGPSAAAIYGTRANAGVVIITTKRGASGRTNVSLAQDIGFAQPLRLLGVDGWSNEKIDVFYASNNTRRLLERDRFAAANGNFIDYEDYFYNNTALLTNTRLSINGGNDNTKFFVSAGVTNEDGTVKNTGFERYTIRANIDQKISNSIRLGVSSNYVRSSSDRGFTGNQNNTGASIGYTIAYTPNYFDLRPNEQGIYPNNPYFAENPIALTDNAVNNSLVNRFIQSFTLDVDLYKSNTSFLKFQLNGGLDFLQNTTLIYLPEFLQSQRASANPGDVIWGKQESFNTNLQAAFIYNWNIGQVNMNSTAGLVRLDFNNNGLFNRGRGLAPGQRNIQQATIQSIDQQFFSEVQEAGVFVQQEANYDDKIIGTVGIRWDKSTLNGDNNQFYAFPRASLAVNVANFDFWNVGAVSQLKPRIAYGETAGPVGFGATFTPLGGANVGGLLGSVVSTAIGNTSILPETAQELEFGIDAGFLNNRINLEATYYIKTTQNNIQNLNLSPATGVNTTPSNEAELENKGIELALSAVIVDNAKMRWFSRVMWWKNEALITRLGIPTYLTGAFGSGLGTYMIAEGFAPTTIVGTPVDTSVPGGFTIWGDAQPDFNLSWFNSINIAKNLDITWLFDWKKGGDNINLTNFLTDGGGTTAGWFGDDNNDGVPNGRQREPAPYNNAGRWVQDASFIKLREVGVYYTLPNSFTSGLFDGAVQKIRVGASANNLLLITDYEGYDPETSTFGAAALANNVDIAPYPTPRRIFFHINIDF